MLEIQRALLEQINDRVLRSYRTTILGGFAEPLYLPASEGAFAQIRFTLDSFQSALHELAHWSLSGEERRAKMDYGYWYRPDGRNAEEQKRFFEVEVKPQAIERIFSEGARVSFDVSCDNLAGEAGDVEDFRAKVEAKAIQYRNEGLPTQAKELLCIVEEWAQSTLVNPATLSCGEGSLGFQEQSPSLT